MSLRCRFEVLVTATGDVHQHGIAEFLVVFFEVGKRVRRLQGGNDSLELRETVERLQRDVVVDVDRCDALLIDKVGEFRADTGVVRPDETEWDS